MMFKKSWNDKIDIYKNITWEKVTIRTELCKLETIMIIF